jgi:hypothetical protein
LCQFEIYTMYVILKNNILEINFRHSWIWWHSKVMPNELNGGLI